MHAALGRAGMEQQQQPPQQQQQATGSSSGSRECSGGHEDVRKCGYLRKHKSAHRRFFVLRGASDAGGPARLEYYDSEKKFRGGVAPPRRSVSLAACLGIIRRADAKHKHLLTLYTKDECLAMAADSEEQQAEWYAALTELHDEFCRAPHGAGGAGGGCGAAAGGGGGGGGGAGGGIFGAASDAGGGGGDSGEDAGPAGCAGGSYGTMPATPVFKEVWQVNLKPKGLGQTRNLTGVFRLCLGTRTISFVKLNADAAAVNLQLMNIRRCGHSESFFFIEVGRSAVTGPGEFWMQVEDCVVAQNMHETILEAMRAMSEEFRPRSKSQTSGGTGGAGGAAGGHHRRQQRYQPPPSQTGLNRRSRAESVAGASPVSGGVTPQGFCASQLRNRASSEGDGPPGAPRSESADAISARLLLLQGEDAEGRLQSSQLVCAGRRQQQQQHHQHHQHHQQQQHGQVIASYQRHQSRMQQQQQGHLHHHQQQQQLHHAAATLLPGRSVSAPIARSPPAGGCSPSSLLLFSASSLITSPVSVSSSSGRGSVDAPCCVGSLGSTGGGGAGGGVGGAAGHAAVGAGGCGAAVLPRGSRPSSTSMSLGSLSDGGFVSSDEYGSSPCEPRGSATPDSPSPTPCAIREEEEAAAAAAAAVARGGPYAYMQMGRARVYRAAPRGQDAPDVATSSSTTSSTSPGFPLALSSSQSPSSPAAAVAAALALAEKGVVRKRTYSCASASAGPAMPPAALGPCLQQREQEKTASQEEYAVMGALSYQHHHHHHQQHLQQQHHQQQHAPGHEAAVPPCCPHTRDPHHGDHDDDYDDDDDDGGGGDDEEDDDAGGGGGGVRSRLVRGGDDGYMPMLPGVTASVAGRCRSGGDADYVPMGATGARDGDITAAAATTTKAAARGSLIHQQRQRHHHHHHQQQQPWQRGQDGLCDARPQDAATGYMVMSPGAGEGQAAGSIKTWPRPSVANGSSGGGGGVGVKAGCERSVEVGPPGAGDYMNMAMSPSNPAVVADTAAVPEGCYFSPMRDGEGAGGAGGGADGTTNTTSSSSSSSFYSLPRSFRSMGQQSSRLTERTAATRPLGEVIREARDAGEMLAAPTPTSRPAALSRPHEDASSSDPGREGGARVSGAPRRVGGAAAEGVAARNAQGRWQGAPPEPRSPGEYVHIDCAAAAKAASQPVSSSSAWRPPQHAAGPQQGKAPDGCRAAHRGPPYLALSSGGAAATAAAAAAASAATAQTRGDRRRRSANEYMSVATAARAGGPPASVPAGPRPTAHPGPWDATSAGRGAPVGGDYTEMSRRGEASAAEEEAAGRRRDAGGGYSAPTVSYRAPHGSYNLQHHHHGNHNDIHHYQLLQQQQQHKPLPLPQQQQHQHYHQQEHHHQHPQQQHQPHAAVRPGYAALKPCVPPRVGLAFQPYAAGSGAVVIPATTVATAAPPPPPPPPPPPAALRRQSAFSVVPPAAAQHGATRPGTAATADEEGEERPRGGVARVAVASSAAATPQRPGTAVGHHGAGPVREAAGSHPLRHQQQHHQQQHHQQQQQQPHQQHQQQLESGLNYIALDLRGEEGSAGSRGSVSSVDSNGYATIDFSRSESAG